VLRVLRQTLLPCARRIQRNHDLIRGHFGEPPNLFSREVEGLDLPILQTFAFGACHPCALFRETLRYTEYLSARKPTDIVDLMHASRYMTYADAFACVNIVCVDQHARQNRPC
jgi:hypothetical protein